MWGEQALGKLVARRRSAEAAGRGLRRRGGRAGGGRKGPPPVAAFHRPQGGGAVRAADRRCRSDEALTGLARGFAFRLVEALGVLPREGVAAEVKALDQDARGALRKHGIRFGQYTIFLPALLKPAPTRLRLVLWSLATGAGRVPRKPAAGSGDDPEYRGHARGQLHDVGLPPRRARGRSASTCWNGWPTCFAAEDSRAGFEAKADMLSITGMTLDQFADLMQGLGYAAEKGERKAKPGRRQPRELTAEEIHAEAERGPPSRRDADRGGPSRRGRWRTCRTRCRDGGRAADGSPPKRFAGADLPGAESRPMPRRRKRPAIGLPKSSGRRRRRTRRDRRGGERSGPAEPVRTDAAPSGAPAAAAARWRVSTPSPGARSRATAPRARPGRPRTTAQADATGRRRAGRRRAAQGQAAEGAASGEGVPGPPRRGGQGPQGRRRRARAERARARARPKAIRGAPAAPRASRSTPTTPSRCSRR